MPIRADNSTQAMRLWAVSDLHISGSDDPLYSGLLALLRERVEAGDQVVLAGDVFDLFVGSKAVFVERYRDFFDAVRALGDRSVQVHYIEGNHDFQIKNAFKELSSIRLHSHDVSVEVLGQRFYFAHGDTVDRSDYGYRLLRAFFRSPLMKAAIALAPGSWVDAVGKFSSRKSRAAKPLLTHELPIERAECLRKAYRSFAAERIAEGYDYVVLGHCHDLDEMKFKVGARTGHYMNIGYPRQHKSMLCWESGERELHRVPLPGI